MAMPFHTDKEPEAALNKLMRIVKDTRPANLHESVNVTPDGRGGYRAIAESTRSHAAHSSVEIRIRPDATGSVVQFRDYAPDSGFAEKAESIEDKVEREWFERR